MLLCWVVKTLMVPPLLLLLERRQPIADASARRGSGARIRRFGMGYGRVFAWLVPEGAAALLRRGACCSWSRAWSRRSRYVRRDPMEYDLRRDRERSERQRASCTASGTGSSRSSAPGHEGMVVLADTPEDARELENKLQADWDARARGRQAVRRRAHALGHGRPTTRRSKIPILLEIGERLERARERGFLTDADWDKVKDYIPPHGPASLRARRPARAPRAAVLGEGRHARTARRHRAGAGQLDDDLRYLLRYSDSFRETRLASGKIVRGSGRAVIFADILKAVVRDIPQGRRRCRSRSRCWRCSSRSGSGGGTRSRVLFALLVGVAGEAVFLYFADVKINFLNFAALPITFGIGVDYAVNVVQRYRADGSRDILGRAAHDGRRRGALQPHDDPRLPRAPRLAQPRASAAWAPSPSWAR